jgi:hypothetical protein
MITSDYFSILDWWFYEVGVNVVAVDTRNKTVPQSWKTDQDKAITTEEFEKVKKKGMFSRGAAVVAGKVWRGPNVGYFLADVDYITSRETSTSLRRRGGLRNGSNITTKPQVKR